MILFSFDQILNKQMNEINKNGKCYENDVMGVMGGISFCGYSIVMESSLQGSYLRKGLRIRMSWLGEDMEQQ